MQNKKEMNKIECEILKYGNKVKIGGNNYNEIANC